MRGLRAFRNRPANRRQRSDLATLAHIKEQSRLSLGSYGRPRMTEELKEIRSERWSPAARQAIAKQSAARASHAHKPLITA